MRYWLISDADVDAVKAGLTAITHEANSYNCEEWPPGDLCTGCSGDEERKSALHAFESGLHKTDAIPEDM